MQIMHYDISKSLVHYLKMKNFLYLLFVAAALSIADSTNSLGQGLACPNLTANDGLVNCATPCATITATPNVTLAATTSYSVASVPYVPFSYTAGTTATFAGAPWSSTTDDSYGDLVTLPFSFCYFGNTYNAIAIGTNANICFNTTGAASVVNAYDPYSISGPLPGSNCAATKNAIMGVWCDTYVGGGDITYNTYGVAPCRQFVISWNAVDLFLPGTYCDGNTLTSQIVLYETFNYIDIYIGNRQPCTSWNSGYAVTGIENAAGTTFYCPTGENGTTFSATNLGWRFTPTGAGGGWSYSWAGPSGPLPDTGATVVLCPTSTSVYTVTATSTSCSGVTISATSTVTASSATGTISGVSSVCVGGSATLTGGTAGGAWSSSNPSVATINSGGVVTALSAGTTSITYNATGCLATMIFTVNPIPAAPIPNTDAYCQLAVAHPVSASGTGLTWYGPGITPGSATAPTPSTATSGSTTYYVTQTSAFGCVSDSATDIVTVAPQPPPPTTNDTSYCQFASGTIPLNLEVESAPGATLNWFTSTGSPLPGAPLPSTNIPDYPAGTTWNVSQTVNGCESNTAPIKVTILPTPQFTMAYQSPVCFGDSVVINYVLSLGSFLVSPTYLWTIPPASSLANGTQVTDPSVTLRFETANAVVNTGYLTINNFGGRCTSTDTFIVRVIPLPTASAYSNPGVCKGDTVSLALAAHSADAANFTWYIDGALMSSSPALNVVTAASGTGGPFLISWNDTGLHVITLTAATVEGCQSEMAYDTVRVHALPDATFDFATLNPGSLCLEDSVLFTALNKEYNNSYLWQPAQFFDINNGPSVWGKVELATSDVTLTVTDPYGCKASSTKEFNPGDCCSVVMPMAFSPNADGQNDYYRPLFAGYHRFHIFRVTNRWGQTVYETTNNLPEWDGTFGGIPQDMGVYFYYIKFDCGGKTVEQKGDITLVR